ncbi:MAG: tetratricopeptide repeat protein, partial [Candidatus Zixiibacteriota bacterium]
EKDNMPKQINDTKIAELKRSFDNGVLQIRHADSVTEVMKTETVDSVKTKQADIVKQLLAKAEGLFNDCVLIDDTIAGVWTNLALIEKKQGNTAKALEHYQRSYKLNSTDAMMVYDLASTYFDEKDFANAARYYGEFGDLDTTNAEAAYINQAMCYQQLNDNAGLEKSLNKILEVNPANAEIRYQRGVMQVRNASAPGLRDSANKLDSLLTLKPNDAGLKQAKDDLVKYRQSFNEKALADFKLAAEGNEKEPLYWYWYGNTAYFLEKSDESIEAYKKCVAADEKFKDCWCQLSILYARKGLKTEAQAAATKCEAK